MPMSHTSTSPAASDPGGQTRPLLAAWKVTVTSAATAPAAMLPVAASTPEGTSTATTGTPRAPAALMQPRPTRPPGPELARGAGAQQAVDHQLGLVPEVVGHVADAQVHSGLLRPPRS